WLGHGDTALARLNQYLDAPRYMEPNTFYAEAGPVIETPLSAATSIQERLDRGSLRSSAGRWGVPGERRASQRAHRVGANRESRRSTLPSRGQRLGRGRGACEYRGGASAATHAHGGGRVRNRPVKGRIGDARARGRNVAARRDAGPPTTHAPA